MTTTTKSLATATIAATALAGLTFAVAPGANAAPAAATKMFSKTLQDKCTVNPFGANVLGATVSGTVPASVKHGTAFKMTNAKFKVTVPAGLNANAYAAGGRFMKVTFKVVNVNNVKILPATKDIIATNIVTAFVPVPNGKPSNFVAPATGGLTVPLTAGPAGVGRINVGSVSATYTLYNGAKVPLLANQVVSCGVPKTGTGAPVNLTTINIT